MPRYYFDVVNGRQVDRDLGGTELPGLDAVREEALRRLPDLTHVALPDNERRDFSVQVRDATGRPILGAIASVAVTPFAQHSRLRAPSTQP